MDRSKSTRKVEVTKERKKLNLSRKELLVVMLLLSKWCSWVLERRDNDKENGKKTKRLKQMG